MRLWGVIPCASFLVITCVVHVSIFRIYGTNCVQMNESSVFLDYATNYNIYVRYSFNRTNSALCVKIIKDK